MTRMCVLPLVSSKFTACPALMVTLVVPVKLNSSMVMVAALLGLCVGGAVGALVAVGAVVAVGFSPAPDDDSPQAAINSRTMMANSPTVHKGAPGEDLPGSAWVGYIEGLSLSLCLPCACCPFWVPLFQG